MSQDVFFKNFELLADAPNGVQKLRDLILHLAVMGKLVPQDPNDEPASVLLENIKSEKERLFKKGTKSSPSIEEDETPYKLPKEWQWARLEDLVSLLGDGLHGTPKYSDLGDYFFINGNNLSDGKILIKNDTKRVSIDEYNKYKKELNERTVLVSINGTLGNVAFYNNENVILGKSACYFNLLSGINKFYLKLLINTSYFLEYAFKNATGTTIKNVSLRSMRLFLVPLPPLAEQKRIVSKVDELMAFCDKLETRCQRKQEIQSKLNSSALDRMLSAENQDEFEQYWQRICENFDLLYDNPENVEKLKQAILQLAVQGKLVPQDPKDEPASVLIEKIEAKKRLLIKEGKIKNTKIQTQIESQEIPYELPDKWERVKIEDITDIGTGTTPLKSKHEYYENGSIPWITSSLTSLSYVDKPETYITETAVKECNLRMYPSGTLIVALYGQGKTRGQVSELRTEATINQACAAIVFIENFESIRKYVKLFFEQQYEELRALAAGGAQPNLNVGKIKETLIPLPPLEEQKRIVEKVERFMGLCDELESKLRKSRENSEILMETAVRGLLEGATAEI